MNIVSMQIICWDVCSLREQSIPMQLHCASIIYVGK